VVTRYHHKGKDADGKRRGPRLEIFPEGESIMDIIVVTFVTSGRQVMVLELRIFCGNQNWTMMAIEHTKDNNIRPHKAAKPAT
jgi:hypothetical protein